MPANKRVSFRVLVFVSVAGLFMASGCIKEPPPVPWPSRSFAGVFIGNEVCTQSVSTLDTITITATAAKQISITNLYGSGKVFYGTINNDTSCTLEPQLYNNGNGNAVLQGSFLLTNNTIRLNLIVSTFGLEDNCNAVLVKH
jgi:hypothetical protein